MQTTVFLSHSLIVMLELVIRARELEVVAERGESGFGKGLVRVVAGSFVQMKIPLYLRGFFEIPGNHEINSKSAQYSIALVLPCVPYFS
jgi:hypothetical protein